MNRRLLTLLLVFAPLAAAAQEGSVLYTESVKFEINLPPEMESMRDRIPNSRELSKMLLFNESASLMKYAPKDEDADDAVDIGGDGFRFRMMRGPMDDNQRFTNLDDEIVIEKRDFLGRTFLITGERDALAWRLTDEQSEYLGYKCLKAVAQRDTVSIEAWFTPEIPVSAGPEEFGGLPGLILVVNEDDGRRTYTATEVKLEPVAEGVLAPPSDGKQVTKEEFQALMEEKMKEMGIEAGGRSARPAMRMMIRGN